MIFTIRRKREGEEQCRVSAKFQPTAEAGLKIARAVQSDPLTAEIEQHTQFYLLERQRRNDWGISKWRDSTETPATAPDRNETRSHPRSPAARNDSRNLST